MGVLETLYIACFNRLWGFWRRFIQSVLLGYRGFWRRFIQSALIGYGGFGDALYRVFSKVIGVLATLYIVFSQVTGVLATLYIECFLRLQGFWRRFIQSVLLGYRGFWLCFIQSVLIGYGGFGNALYRVLLGYGGFGDALYRVFYQVIWVLATVKYRLF